VVEAENDLLTGCSRWSYQAFICDSFSWLLSLDLPSFHLLSLQLAALDGAALLPSVII